MKTRSTGLLIIAGWMFGVLPTAVVWADEKPELVTSPVMYDWGMLIVVSPEGAGAVRFAEPFERGNQTGNGVIGVKYHWRFLSREADAVEQTGTGQVYANLKQNEVRNGTFDVECGPLSLTWAHRDKSSGVVQYDPRRLAVHPLAASYFAPNPDPFGLETEPIDLRRYLNTDRVDPRGRLGGQVIYQDCAVVVRHDSGLAIFEFGEAYELERPKDRPQLHGVPYKSTFLLPDGQRQTRDGKVFEHPNPQPGNNGQLYLKAGPLSMEWSQGSQEFGWIYYEPEMNSVWLVEKASVPRLLETLRTPRDGAGDRP